MLPRPAHINNILKVKGNYIPEQTKVRRMALFSALVNMLNVWLLELRLEYISGL